MEVQMALPRASGSVKSRDPGRLCPDHERSSRQSISHPEPSGRQQPQRSVSSDQPCTAWSGKLRIEMQGESVQEIDLKEVKMTLEP
jgi:hypothetical protein